MQSLLLIWLTAHSIALASLSEPEKAICEPLTDTQKIERVYSVDSGNRVFAVYGKVMTYGYNNRHYENHYVVIVTVDKFGVWQIGDYVWTPRIKVNAKNIKKMIKRIENLNYEGEE